MKYLLINCFLLFFINFNYATQVGLEDEKNLEVTNKLDKAVSINDDLMKKHNIAFGDLILRKVWEYLQFALSEHDKVIAKVKQSENNLQLTTKKLFEMKVESTRSLIKKGGGSCDPSLSNRLDDYLKGEIESVMKCIEISSKNKLKSAIEIAEQSLDDFQIEITKEVSLCELMHGETQTKCYKETFENAEDYKLSYFSEHLINIEKQAITATDKIEGYWLGCAAKGLNDVTKTNQVLEKELECCQENYHNYPCSNMEAVLNEELVPKPHVLDMDVYYLQIKRVDE